MKDQEENSERLARDNIEKNKDRIALGSKTEGLTLSLAEVKFTNFNWVDHLWPMENLLILSIQPNINGLICHREVSKRNIFFKFK